MKQNPLLQPMINQENANQGQVGLVCGHATCAAIDIDKYTARHQTEYHHVHL